MRFDFFERRLSALYYAYAKVVTRWPLPFLVVPILLSVGLSVGCVWRMRVMQDTMELYVASDGPASVEKRTVQTLFPVEEDSLYFAQRLVDNKRAGVVLVTAKDGSSVLNFDSLDEVVRLWYRIKGLVVHNQKKWLSYRNLCIKTAVGSNSTCVQSPLVAAYEFNPLVIGRVNGRTLLDEFASSLGAISRDDKGGIRHAKVLLMPYMLKHGTEETDDLADAWELKLIDFLEAYKSDRIQLYWWTSNTLAAETKAERRAIQQMIAPLVAVVSTFTVLCCLTQDCVRSKPELGFGGVLTAGAAIVSAIGFLGYAGQQFTSVAYFMPFIIFSISVDNVFILVAAWQKTDPCLPVQERLGLVFRDAGVSITVTSLTDALSFGIGCQISFLSVKVFCLYAATAMVFVYVYQLTIFAALMVYSGRREEAGHICFSCRTYDDDLYKHPHGHDMNGDIPEEKRGTIVDDRRGNVASRFFRDVYAVFIVKPAVQGIVVTLFLVYLGAAVYGCTRIKTGLLPTDLLPDGSQAHEALQIQYGAFLHDSGKLHVMFTSLSTELEYSRTDYWTLLEAAIDRFEDTKYTGTGDFWLRTFVLFAKTRGIELTKHNFVQELHKFLQEDDFRKYQLDVKINPIQTRLLYSRVPIQLVNVNLENQASAISFLREVASAIPLNCTVFAPFFQFADQHGILIKNMLVNVGMASAAVIVTSLLLIPRPACSIWVCLTIGSINTGILGYMAFWGVKLDFISMVTIVMSIGFSVDFSAHIAYHFAVEKHKTAKERIRSALYSVGTPILQSAASTLLGMSVLVWIDSYIYQSFIKTIILVVTLGVFHGLLVLPVFLTIFHFKDSPAAVSDLNRGSPADPSHLKASSISNISVAHSLGPGPSGHTEFFPGHFLTGERRRHPEPYMAINPAYLQGARTQNDMHQQVQPNRCLSLL